jgi:hypothetical protein
VLAEFAGGYRVRLCVAHRPDGSMSSPAEVLPWLREVRHDNLALLLDVGACLRRPDPVDPAALAEQAGPLLGHVRVPTWLPPAALAGVLHALRRCGYRAPVGLTHGAPEDDLAGCRWRAFRIQ